MAVTTLIRFSFQLKITLKRVGQKIFECNQCKTKVQYSFSFINFYIVYSQNKYRYLLAIVNHFPIGRYGQIIIVIRISRYLRAFGLDTQAYNHFSVVNFEQYMDRCQNLNLIGLSVHATKYGHRSDYIFKRRKGPRLTYEAYSNTHRKLYT